MSCHVNAKMSPVSESRAAAPTARALLRAPLNPPPRYSLDVDPDHAAWAGMSSGAELRAEPDLFRVSIVSLNLQFMLL